MTKPRQRRRSLRDLSVLERTTVKVRCGGWRCYWCKREPAEVGALTLEHLQPISQGGEEHVRNYALACERCNKSRGNRPRPTPRRGL